MLLVIDVGNSQTSFGVFQTEQALHHWRAQTNRYRTAEEYLALLAPLLERAGLQNTKWEAVAVCSVVPAVESALEVLAKTYLNAPVFTIHRKLDLGFTMAVHEPHAVGADRLANAAWAVRKLKLPAVVVDCGTATKFEILNKDKGYEGGAILPGLRLAVESLHVGTAKLPHVALRLPKSVMGKTTEEALQAGILIGHIEIVEGILRRVEEELGATCDTVLTGGFASVIAPGLTRKLPVIPDLTLESIAYLCRQHARP